MSTTDAPESVLRGGRYAIVRVLGEGSQGATFEAVDKREGQLVAIKRFSVRGAKSWKEVELAEREARVLASLAPHPSLPRYIEHFEEGEHLYLVTQKIEGESLLDLRRRGAQLGEADVVRFLRDASAALEHLHGRDPPLVHRDIKPSNVIRKPDGSFSLIDFGSVRDRLKPEGGSTVVGTFGFMAPEQFQGRALPVSDVYATAATALTLLTGREPEHLPHRGLAIDVHAALGHRANPALARALAAMLDPDPDRRARRIAPLLDGLGRPPSKRSRDAKSKKERRREARDERRAERHARRMARRSQRIAERLDASVPWFVVVLVTLGLTIAQLAVIFALRVVVPVVLTLLSFLFGAGLRRAARDVSDAGIRATAAIARARESFQTQEPPPRVRVDDTPATRVGGNPEEEAEDEIEDVPEARRQKAR